MSYEALRALAEAGRDPHALGPRGPIAGDLYHTARATTQAASGPIPSFDAGFERSRTGSHTAGFSGISASSRTGETQGSERPWG